jgi:hypothetical protein
MIPKSGDRFSNKIMRKQESEIAIRLDRIKIEEYGNGF